MYSLQTVAALFLTGRRSRACTQLGIQVDILSSGFVTILEPRYSIAPCESYLPEIGLLGAYSKLKEMPAVFHKVYKLKFLITGSLIPESRRNDTIFKWAVTNSIPANVVHFLGKYFCSLIEIEALLKNLTSSPS